MNNLKKDERLAVLCRKYSWPDSGNFKVLPEIQFFIVKNSKLSNYIIAIALAIFCLASSSVNAQTTFEQAMANKIDSLLKNGSSSDSKVVLYSDYAPLSMMSPTGFGGSGTYVYGGLGGTYPELYAKNKTDLIAFGGLSFGNPVKAVNVAIGLNMTDVHRFSDFSTNLNISRQLPAGNSVAIGTFQLFTNSAQTDSKGTTFYLVFSHAVQWLPSKTPGASALTYSLGIGSGRFLYKSPADIKAGKGQYATAVFANVSYEIIRNVNINTEWYGTNLGISAGVRPFANPLSISVGVDNLTQYSGDHASMVFTIGYPLSVKRSAAK
ncbi:hypothetical protein [Mucilaginibacter paludis]|uniref:Uncharacterized protein n=1 Tax=Mucilaginibacter paludis DSM 18603 TaxID=714943 RepID=H1YID5_9SPHI|nr:hypothetical protein [Mucilaginibacter paludis]EHQ27548.1 hypothetical protein Mucpa_3449 [Mucilaginibacter paludis DSM 18603]